MKTFDGPSSALKGTKIVPTLKTPVGETGNAIWCSSFLAAWKSLADQVSGTEVSIEGSPKTAGMLNEADDPRSHVPTGSMLAATGGATNGIINKISEELRASFPDKPAATFPGIADGSFVAYAYLEANVEFSLPFFQSRKPLEFTDSQGRKSRVASFGIRDEDDYAYYNLRSQPRVLFKKGDVGSPGLEFAVDLCAESSPSQIVVARIEKQATLEEALALIKKGEDSTRRLKVKEPDYARSLEEIGPNDTLLVPDLFWQISHRFSELEGRPFLNPELKEQRLDIAQQDVLFRLDRSGAELKSEAKMYCLPEPTHFVLDRPFLICMRKRGSAMPYFVMWVDNAELLTPWVSSHRPDEMPGGIL